MLKHPLITLAICTLFFLGGCVAGITMSVATFISQGYRLQEDEHDPLDDFVRARRDAINKQRPQKRTQRSEESVDDIYKRHEELKQKYGTQ